MPADLLVLVIKRLPIDVHKMEHYRNQQKTVPPKLRHDEECRANKKSGCLFKETRCGT